jgi:mono/diheme cytochrome c family protein
MIIVIFEIKIKKRTMKTFKKILLASAVAVIGMAFVTSTLYAQAKPKPWDAPANYKSMKNPIAQSDASKSAGGALYNKNCASCHGKTGLGDGVKARALQDFPGDFSKADFQGQTDGEHFYKTKVGRGEMPKYEGKLTDDDMWNIVNYMRSFKK